MIPAGVFVTAATGLAFLRRIGFAPKALAVALAGLLVLAVLVRRHRLGRLRRSFADPLPARFPYRARPSLLSKNEAAFYRALGAAVGDRWAVAPKVRLADVVRCPPPAWRLGYGRLIAQKHLDFVLCDPRTLPVVLAIEVDDRSHARPGRQARDEFVNRALGAAGVPLVRIRAAARYEASQVRAALGQGRP